MSAPVTKEHTKKAFHFPKSATKRAADGAEPAVAAEQLAEAAPLVGKAAKSKRSAAAEAKAVVKKAAKAKRSATAEAAPAAKKADKAKRSATAEAAPAAKKTVKTKRSATVEAAPVAKKAAKPKRSVAAETAPVVKKATKPKRAATAEAAPADAPEAKKAKPPKKEKVVRDSFTMPKSDYDKIASLKQTCLDAGVSVKKSELLRAGLMMLVAAAPQRLVAAVSSLETVKTGRPAKG
ncbi:hypothetical protein [Paraburkholderia domus]|uniref:Histone H1 n=1 Tax=Paraburkholderia domus TaxID=2793075 RepID=A0A9N8MKU3_9BURK|nr:hypothetical protein [Paraburkholderia domus]MBK5164472.1 hypothetical protein [Burkholderia sp. R-70211]CAE6870741.1 hypothetical protein R70211_01213 [Paraburkholderia domus]CAE6874968.1 hypothetical protein R75471_01307 [Paraburkholderia domus]